MYAGESRAVSVAAGDEGQMPSDSGPALEVIELANGETVWYEIFSPRNYFRSYPPSQEYC